MIRRDSKYVHAKSLSSDGKTVRVECSMSDCGFTAETPVGTNGAQRVFAIFNRHLRDVGVGV